MKKILVLIIFLFVVTGSAFCETLKGSTSYDESLRGFFGTWHVTSKIESATNYLMFNKLSVDIWNLSAQNNVLFLENGLTGAKSSITIDTNYDNLNGKKLQFTRVKEFSEGGFKYRHTEMPEFILEGDVFRGYDTFKIEKFDKQNNPLSVDVVKYKVVGQKIAGD